MSELVRLIKHEAVPKCGSFEVRFSDGRPSRFFYWDDIPGRCLHSDQVNSEKALERATIPSQTAPLGLGGEPSALLLRYRPTAAAVWGNAAFSHLYGRAPQPWQDLSGTALGLSFESAFCLNLLDVTKDIASSNGTSHAREICALSAHV